MKRRRPIPRSLNVHRNYTSDEVARACSVHLNTVRNWIRNGLEVCDDKRPVLICGSAVREFLAERRTKAKRRSGPGQLYCLRCRASRFPAGGMLDFEKLTATSGRLIALCTRCETPMYRCVRIAELESVRGDFAVTFTGGQ